MEMLFERVAGLDVSKASVTVCVRTPGPVSAETRFAERRQRREARTPARYASTLRADAPHAAHALPTGPGPESRQAWLQSWLQFSSFAAVRPCSPPFARARQVAYGTTRNRHERDHVGLAVWGSGVLVPSAPP